MLNQLTDIEVAKLQTYFVIPMAVQKMVMNNEPLDADDEYALHESLSEMQPDSALIAIALCARYIGFAIGGKEGTNLLNHSAFIVSEYGSAWLAHAEECLMESEIIESEGKNLDNTILLDLLMDTPEDLSSISMMLTACAQKIEEKSAILTRLCQIMAIQAASHSDIAELYVDAVLQSQKQKPLTHVADLTSPLNNKEQPYSREDFQSLTQSDPEMGQIISFTKAKQSKESVHA